MAAGALRGLNDTRVPLLLPLSVSGVWHSRADYGWPSAVALGAVGVWIGLSVGLACLCRPLGVALPALTRRGYLPALAG